MDANLDKIAQDLYGKIQTRFPDIRIGDEHAEVLSKKEDIPRARFFEFDYEKNGNIVGTFAITLDYDDGIILQISDELSDKDILDHETYNFIRSFRKFAKNRLLNFDIQNIGKSNLDKRDYNFKSTRKEEPVMAPIMENKMYGTNKISYQDLGEARLIVKHNQPVNQELAAGRTMHIESIYIENAKGERFMYPFKHLNGARALAEHIKHGGIPYDAIGKHITSLSEELAGLRKFKGFVSRNPMVSESMGAINSKVIQRIEEIKKEVHGLQRTTYYEQFVESFQETEEQMIPEDVVNDWVDRLTIRTFNEELKSVFPYIYKIVDETFIPVKELSVDDLLDETTGVTDYTPTSQGGTRKELLAKFKKSQSSADATAARKAGATQKELQDAKTESYDPAAQFESFMDSIISEDDNFGLMSADPDPQSIEKFLQLMSKPLIGGADNSNSTGSLKLLLPDPELMQELEQAPPNVDSRSIVYHWLEDNSDKFDQGTFAQLINSKDSIGRDDVQSQGSPVEPVATPEVEPVAQSPVEPVEPAPVEPVEPAPVAESNKLRAKFIRARECGAKLDTMLEFGSRAMSLQEAIEECGMTPMECGFSEPEDDMGHDSMHEETRGIHEIKRFISGFWNKEEQNFTIGATRLKIKVLKDLKDGAFKHATPRDVKVVFQEIEAMDPSTDHNQQHNDIVRLSGIKKPSDNREMHMDELVNELGDMSAVDTTPSYVAEDIMQQIIKNAGLRKE